jgi:16S rRNA (adenine1518-N6/adenine1519-N6)-dimethyltransferase
MNHKAKKSLGQNFLQDKNIKQKIFDIVSVNYQDYHDLKLVEIGPGLGDLTEQFLQISNQLEVYEIDADLIPILEERFKDLKIYNVDFMDALANLSPSYLVSNLPYYIGSRLVIDLIIYNCRFPFTFILQKEVVMKTKKSEKITLFGAMVNYFYDVKVELNIPPSAFKPAPKVQSALFSGKPKVNDIDGIQAINIFKAMFFKPTKTLYNNLQFGGFEKDFVDKVFQNNMWDDKLRINWGNYEAIFLAIYKDFSV